jgi:hypothetical protein
LQKLIAKDQIFFKEYLNTVRHIVKLNGSVPGVWRTYFSLVGILSKDLGRTKITDLVLMEGRRPQDLECFSSIFQLTHERLLHDRILVEYDPRVAFEAPVEQGIREISANTERCVIFTRKAGKILTMIKELENVETRVLVTPGVQEEGSVPFNDVTRLLQAVNEALESEFETWILFDNISDLLISAGFDQSYTFVRRATDIVASKNGSIMFLLNKGAHTPETRAAFEGLFSTIIEIGDKSKLIKGLY